jgi:hypothetical protein
VGHDVSVPRRVVAGGIGGQAVDVVGHGA